MFRKQLAPVYFGVEAVTEKKAFHIHDVAAKAVENLPAIYKDTLARAGASRRWLHRMPSGGRRRCLSGCLFPTCSQSGRLPDSCGRPSWTNSIRGNQSSLPNRTGKCLTHPSYSRPRN